MDFLWNTTTLFSSQGPAIAKLAVALSELPAPSYSIPVCIPYDTDVVVKCLTSLPNLRVTEGRGEGWLLTTILESTKLIAR